MYKFYFVIGILVLTSLGCALFENFDELPMFITVESVGVTTNPSQGSASHDIRDIWPSVDGQSIGVFEMPATFPVLDDDGIATMTYFAGIRRVGFMDDHTIYPFYERIIVDKDFEPESTCVENLTFNYLDDLSFRLVEDFELSHVFTRDVDEDLETDLSITSVGCFEGNCGLMTLTEENPEVEVATSSEIGGIPTNGTPVYLEINYQTEINLNIGLQAVINGTEFEQYFLTLTPNNIWNKRYIDLSEILQDSGLDTYRILFGATYQGSTSAEIRIDNVKLIHF